MKIYSIAMSRGYFYKKYSVKHSGKCRKGGMFYVFFAEKIL